MFYSNVSILVGGRMSSNQIRHISLLIVCCFLFPVPFLSSLYRTFLFKDKKYEPFYHETVHTIKGVSFD